MDITAANSDVNRITLCEQRCPVCGATYLAEPARLRHGRQSTCSRACSYKLRAGLRAPPYFVKAQKQKL